LNLICGEKYKAVCGGNTAKFEINTEMKLSFEMEKGFHNALEKKQLNLHINTFAV